MMRRAQTALEKSERPDGFGWAREQNQRKQDAC
jgi:hypothetical protein